MIRTTSISEIIERVYRDLGDFIQVIDWEFALNQVADAIELLGIPQTYIDRVTNNEEGMPFALEVINYKCELPPDCVQVLGIRNFKTKTPFMESTNIYHRTLQPPPATSSYDGTDDFTVFNGLTEAQINEDPEMRALFYNYKETHLMQTENIINEQMLQQSTINDGTNYTYKIENGWIYTNVTNILLELAYKALMLDKDGMPLILDDIKIKLYTAEYLKERLAYKLYLIGKIDKNMYAGFQQERTWAYNRAKTGARTPNTDKMENLMRNWIRFIPDVRGHKNGFKFINEQERIYRQ